MHSLKQIIDEHINNDIYPFHMPGHKQNYRFFEKDILKYDLTEFGYLDNLNDPKEAILQLNLKLATLFSSYKSFVLVNGSTSGIISAISSICSNGDTIIASRNSHKSFFSAVHINGCNTVYTYPKVLPNGIVTGVCPLHIDKLLTNNPTAKCVFITSPTYEGIVSDVDTIASVVHKHNKILIVDEAHGAHLNLHKYFPNSANCNNADIVIQSLHKTLPTLTQTSIIHVNSNRVDLNSLKKYMYMLQTSSPSYLFLYALDTLVDNINNNYNFFNSYISKLSNFRKKFNQLVGVHEKITLLDFNDNKNNLNIHSYDKSKLTFILNCNLHGKDIELILRNEFNLQIEFSSINYFLAMTSVCDTQEGFDLLINALVIINERIHYKKFTPIPSISESLDSLDSSILNQKKTENNSDVFSSKHSPALIHLDESKNISTNVNNFRGIPSLIHLDESKNISTNVNIFHGIPTLIHLDDTLNKNYICSDFITPYPPGIPIIVPNEIITNDLISLIKTYLNYNIEVQGIHDFHISCIL